VTISPNAAIANTVVVYYGQIQLELGSAATPFSRAGGTFQQELAACQRYYKSSTATYDGYLGQCAATTTARIGFPLPVSMRVAPSVSLRSGTPQIRSALTQATQNATAATLAIADGSMVVVDFTLGTALTQGALVTYVANSSIIDFSAEL
jgi:hypothetical protein